MTPAKKTRLSTVPATPRAVPDVHRNLLRTSDRSAYSVAASVARVTTRSIGANTSDRRDHDPPERAAVGAEARDDDARDARPRRAPRRSGRVGPHSSPSSPRGAPEPRRRPGHDTVRRMSADAGLVGVPGAVAPAHAPAAGPPQAPPVPGSPAVPALARASRRRPPRLGSRRRRPRSRPLHRRLHAGGCLRVAAPAHADFNIWWVAVPPSAGYSGRHTARAGRRGLIGYAAAPRMRPWRRWSTVALCARFAAVTAWNGVGFYRAWHGG